MFIHLYLIAQLLHILTVSSVLCNLSYIQCIYELIRLMLQHMNTRLTALCPVQPGWAGTRKVTSIWILLKQETVSASGISWAVRKSAPHSRQITTPAPDHSVYLQARCPSCIKALKAANQSKWVQFVYCHISLEKFTVGQRDVNSLLEPSPQGFVDVPRKVGCCKDDHHLRWAFVLTRCSRHAYKQWDRTPFLDACNLCCPLLSHFDYMPHFTTTALATPTNNAIEHIRLRPPTVWNMCYSLFMVLYKISLLLFYPGTQFPENKKLHYALQIFY